MEKLNENAEGRKCEADERLESLEIRVRDQLEQFRGALDDLKRNLDSWKAEVHMVQQQGPLGKSERAGGNDQRAGDDSKLNLTPDTEAVAAADPLPLDTATGHGVEKEEQETLVEPGVVHPGSEEVNSSEPSEVGTDPHPSVGAHDTNPQPDGGASGDPKALESGIAGPEGLVSRREMAAELTKMAKEFQDHLSRKDSQIHQLESRVIQLEGLIRKMTQRIEEVRGRTGTLPIFYSLHNFNKLKSNNSYWTSPPFYTHPLGYKLCFRVYPNGMVPKTTVGATWISVELCSMKGENDDHLKWPADCTISVQLMNQYHDRDHIVISHRFHWHKPTTQYPWKINWLSKQLVWHSDMDWNTEKETLYLKNNSLVFKITKIDVH